MNALCCVDNYDCDEWKMTTFTAPVSPTTPGLAGWRRAKAATWEIQRLRKKFTHKEMTLKEFHTHILKCNGSIEDLESCVQNRHRKKQNPRY